MAEDCATPRFWPDDYALLKAELAESAQAAERLAETGQAVAEAHRAVIEGVTPKHSNWCADDREEYDARFSRWHSTTRDLRDALASFRAGSSKEGQ